MWYVWIDEVKITVTDLDEIDEYMEKNNIDGWEAEIWVSRDDVSFIEYCELFSR